MRCPPAGNPVSYKIMIRASGAFLVALGLSGCSGNKISPTGNSAAQVESPASAQNSVDHNPSEKDKKMTQIATNKLIVSKRNEGGGSVELGTLTFDESNHATLATKGTGPDVEKLKQDWKEVSSKDELIWKKSIPGEVNGEKVIRIVGDKVHPGDDTYIYAVLNTLERSYGYTTDFAK
jgi:hypothetical protein